MSLKQVSLSSFGISMEQMDEYMESVKMGFRNPDRYICICGHQMARHESSNGISSCVVSRSWCACTEPIAVLDPETVNPFRFSTSGYGRKHALAKGIYALLKCEKLADWLIEVACFRCNNSEVQVVPVALNASMRITLSSGTRNALLCKNCIELTGVVYLD